jgi:hypothetical protein
MGMTDRLALGGSRTITVRATPFRAAFASLLECSVCLSAVRAESFAAHARWHGTVLVAPEPESIPEPEGLAP